MDELEIMNGIPPLVDESTVARATVEQPAPKVTQRCVNASDDTRVIEQCLNALRTHADSYETWYETGMIIKTKMPGADGLSLWESWSSSSSKYKEGECAAKWKSFKQNGELGIGTLVKRAKAAGATIQLGSGVKYRGPKESAGVRDRTPDNPGEVEVDDMGESGPIGPLPDFEDGADLQTAVAVRPDELIEGMCFKGSKVTMSADSKGKKTFFQMDVGVSICDGAPWMDRKTARGKVLYINLELSRYSFQKRLQDICHHRGITLAPGMFTVWHLRGKKITIEQLERELYQRLKSGDYALLIFDPLYKLTNGRSENDASEMGDLLNRLESIAESAGAAYLVAHHFAKGNAAGKKALDRSSGSGVIGRDGDCIITLTEHEEEDCVALECIVRDFPPIPPTVLRWNYPVFDIDSSLNPEALKKPNNPNAKLPISEDDVRAVMTHPMTRNEIVAKVRAVTKRGENAVRETVMATLSRPDIKSETLSRKGTNPLIRYWKAVS